MLLAERGSGAHPGVGKYPSAAEVLHVEMGLEARRKRYSVRESKFLSAAECKIEHVLTIVGEGYYEGRPTPPPSPSRLPTHTHTASLGEFHEELSWRDNEMSWPAQLHSFLREKKKRKKHIC